MIREPSVLEDQGKNSRFEPTRDIFATGRTIQLDRNPNFIDILESCDESNLTNDSVHIPAVNQTVSSKVESDITVAEIQAPIKPIPLKELISVPLEQAKNFKGINRNDRKILVVLCKKVNMIIKKSKIRFKLEIYHSLKSIMRQMMEKSPQYNFQQAEDLLNSYGKNVAHEIELVSACTDVLKEYVNEKESAFYLTEGLKSYGDTDQSTDIVDLAKRTDHLLALLDDKRTIKVSGEIEQEAIMGNEHPFNRIVQPRSIDINAEHLDFIESSGEAVFQSRSCDSYRCGHCVDLVPNKTSTMIEIQNLMCRSIKDNVYYKNFRRHISILIGMPLLGAIVGLISSQPAIFGMLIFLAIVYQSSFEGFIKYQKILRGRLLKNQLKLLYNLPEFALTLGKELIRINNEIQLLDIQDLSKSDAELIQAKNYRRRLEDKKTRINDVLTKLNTVKTDTLPTMEEKMFILALDKITEVTCEPSDISSDFTRLADDLACIQTKYDELLLQKEIIENEGL